MTPYFETELGKLYHGDCLEIMPQLEPVDLVLKNSLTNSTNNANMSYEEKQERSLQDGGGKGTVGATESRNGMALPRSKMVNGANGKLFQRFTNGNEQNTETLENSIKGQGETREGKREIQGRETEPTLSPDDRERQVFKLSNNDEAVCPPQKRGTSGQPYGKPTDTLHELPFKLPQKDVVGQSEIICLTDPPYGIKMDKGFKGFGGFGEPIARKQYPDSWDSKRPSKEHFDVILKISDKAMIFGGNYFADILPTSTHWIVWDKKNTMPTFGDAELMWTNIKRKSVKIFVCEYNGLLGKERTRVHPAQKPIKLIIDLLSKYSKGTDLILDPFLGSGTTAVACERLNRKWIGIEISEKYCEISARRIEKERQQLKLFT